MTTAEKLIEAWTKRKTTFSLGALANELDPGVRESRKGDHPHMSSARTYTFSDGSQAISYGRGKAHRVRALPSPGRAE